MLRVFVFGEPKGTFLLIAGGRGLDHQRLALLNTIDDRRAGDHTLQQHLRSTAYRCPRRASRLIPSTLTTPVGQSYLSFGFGLGAGLGFGLGAGLGFGPVG